MDLPEIHIDLEKEEALLEPMYMGHMLSHRTLQECSITITGGKGMALIIMLCLGIALQ